MLGFKFGQDKGKRVIIVRTLHVLKSTNHAFESTLPTLTMTYGTRPVPKKGTMEAWNAITLTC
ncbi:hypothetical protein ACHAXS_005136 [Conticribra weissflogii]